MYENVMHAGSEIVRCFGALREGKPAGSRAAIFGGFFYSWMTVAIGCDHDSPRRRNGNSDQQ
jgi:hypothetical protein